MPPFRGYPIVLTADRTLMAGYDLLFDGMLAASQTTTTPVPLLGPVLMPRARGGNGRAPFAPLGLRRVEAALLAGGFSPDEVAVVGEEGLRRAIGPDTRVIAVSSGEPAGHGMNTSTMTGVVGGRIWPQAMFARLMRTLRRAAAAAPEAKVILGGPGAWQVAGDPAARRALGIHYVVTGYAEGNAAAIFRALHLGVPLPEVLTGEGVPAGAIPCIRGASTMGVVEISRGCGLGCSFCTIARVPMVHLPAETIAADAETNVAAGRASIAALSEDFFRYGADGLKANPPALLALLERLRRVPGLRLIQIDHTNVVSVAQFGDGELAAVHRLLVGDNRHDYLWVPAARQRRRREDGPRRRRLGRVVRHAPAPALPRRLLPHGQPAPGPPRRNRAGYPAHAELGALPPERAHIGLSCSLRSHRRCIPGEGAGPDARPLGTDPHLLPAELPVAAPDVLG